MKKIFMSAALAMAALNMSAANDGALRIKSSVKGFTNDTIIVYKSRNDKDTIIAKNGKFDKTVKFDKISVFYLVTPPTMRREADEEISFLGVPGETMELSGTVENPVVSGSAFYKQEAIARAAIQPAQKAISDFSKKMNDRIKAGESRDAVVKEYQEKIPALQAAFKDAVMNFIKANPNNEAGAGFISTLDEVEDMEAAAAMLSDNVKNGRMKAYYQGVIDQLKAQAEAEKAAEAATAEGVMAPDFTLNDIRDRPLTLSSLRGKYVLLDFWGSWCVWCIKGFPQLKEYYQKYAGKFEVLGIDNGDTEEKWREAVKKHELPWLHVYNPRDSKATEAYKIQGYPTKILIGPDGKIIKTVVGEDPKFFEIFDQLFGEK